MTKTTNPSGIHPTEYRVLIRPKPVAEKSAGGILLPDEKKDRDQHAQIEGVLIDASPLAFTYEPRANWNDGFPPQIGNKVLFAKYAGTTVKGQDGQEYRLCSDKDITAVLS